MSVLLKTAGKAQYLFNEIWRCNECGREFHDATHCCAHEAQCGSMTHC